MKKTILVVAAVAGLALTAVGQSEKKQDPKKSDTVTSPRDAASGQASGKKGNWDIKKQEGAVQDEQQQAAEKKGNYDVKKQEGSAQDEEQANGRKGSWNIKEGKGAVAEESQASGNKAKPAAADDWQTQSAREASSGMATGKLQNTSQGQPSSNNARETGSGMATGKRQKAVTQPEDKPKK